MKKHLTKVIIVAVCALALGPLFAGFFGPAWRARWMLAWAANEYQNGHPDEAETTLRRASDLSSELATDPEFWKLRFEFVFNKEKPRSEAIKKLFDESVSQISRLAKPQQPVLAAFVTNMFQLNRETDLAIELLESHLPPISQRVANDNNAIAYFRSLAKKKLEIALQEIDTALVADGTQNEMFLDTKAWVLHGLKEDAKALPFANEALKKLYSTIERLGNVRPADRREFQTWLYSDTFEKTNNNDSEIENDSGGKIIDSNVSTKNISQLNRLEALKLRYPYVSPSGIDEIAKTIAAFRFHRACILDELGRTEESDRDYAWLDNFGFTETNKLN